jgi:hypothetical protein
MIHGANGVKPSAGIICANAPETEFVETASTEVAQSFLKKPDGIVTINLESPEPLTCSGAVDKNRRRECAFLTLRNLTVKILQDQQTASSIERDEIESVIIDKITPENAKALVANNGHWGPDQTADRIFSFAVTISGNDRKKFDKIKESILYGFHTAGESFGGEMPGLAYKTLAAILNRLDEWAEISGDFEGS